MKMSRILIGDIQEKFDEIWCRSSSAMRIKLLKLVGPTEITVSLSSCPYLAFAVHIGNLLILNNYSFEFLMDTDMRNQWVTRYYSHFLIFFKNLRI